MVQLDAIESGEFNSRTGKENFSFLRRAWFLLFPRATCSRSECEYESLVYSLKQANNIKKNRRHPAVEKQDGGCKVRDAGGFLFFAGSNLIF